MNASEGLKRIAQVIRWLGYFIAGLCMFFAIKESNSNSGLLIIVSVLFGTLGWAIAWVIDGFAEKK